MIEQLKAEVAARDGFIAQYRFNIRKYERMLARLADGSMPDFAERLEELLATEREQCAREQLTRDVTAELIAEMEANP